MPFEPYRFGRRARRSSSSTFSSYSPFRNQRNPSGLVLMLPATCLAVRRWLPLMSTWLITMRLPSTTRKRTCTLPSGCGISAAVTFAW